MSKPDKVHPLARSPVATDPIIGDCCAALPQKTDPREIVTDAMLAEADRKLNDGFDSLRSNALAMKQRHDRYEGALREIVDEIEASPHSITEHVGTLLRIARAGLAEPLTQSEDDAPRF